MGKAVEQLSRGQPQVQAEWIESQADTLDAQFARILHQDAKHGRMQMQVQMAVDVVERQAGGAEPVKLRVNFLAQLFAQVALKEIAEPGARRVVGEFVLAS